MSITREMVAALDLGWPCDEWFARFYSHGVARPGFRRLATNLLASNHGDWLCGLIAGLPEPDGFALASACTNLRDKRLFGALHYAADTGNTRAAATLLRAGADPNARDALGNTPLHMAASASVVRALVKGGADINASDRAGRTPLHLAAMKRRYSIVRTLLAEGANANAQDFGGDTPLHRAMTYGIARALLAAGADPRVRNNDGFLPGGLKAVRRAIGGAS